MSVYQSLSTEANQVASLSDTSGVPGGGHGSLGSEARPESACQTCVYSAARFEDGRQRSGRDTLAERGHHAAGDENQGSHAFCCRRKAVVYRLTLRAATG
jgi:hypothetical protein